MFLGFPRKRGSKGRSAPLGGVGLSRVGFLGVQGAKPPYRGFGCPQCFSFFLSPPPAARKTGKRCFAGTPQYCSNKNTSSIRDRKKGRKEDKEAVQMAYSSHHHNPERKDMPHRRNDNRERVAIQHLPPDRYGIAARSDSTKPDRRDFGDQPEVGRTR